MIPKFKVSILTNGIITFSKECLEYIKTLELGDYLLSISKFRETRSDRQNRYLWGCVYKLISDEIGHSPEEVHEICKQLFLKDWVIFENKKGEFKEFLTVKSTTDLNTKEMEDYLSKVRQWASMEISCYIPLPNEVEY